jgi:hypothetical protein
LKTSYHQLTILLCVLFAALLFVACPVNTDNDGLVPVNPVPRIETGPLNWPGLLSAIAAESRYIDLDISACTIPGTEFDPGTANTGERYIVSLILPEAATSLKAGVPAFSRFRYFTALKSLSGKNVEIIGNYTFGDIFGSNCTALSTMSLPAVTSIGDRAFYGCTALTTVDLPEATSIGSDSFSGCTALTTVDLPVATSIGGGSFSGCTALTTVNLPMATSTGGESFSGCTALTTVDLPMATNIGGRSFSGCTALTMVSLPVATSIGGSFSGCTALTTVSFPVALSIGSYTFRSCTALTTVSLPMATSIGDCVFFNCTALTTMSLPAATSIGHRAFDDCTVLTTVSLPAATSIGDRVFFDCTALTTVDLPVVVSMGSEVFLGTDSTAALTITLPRAAPTLGLYEYIFSSTSFTKTVTVKAPADRTGYDAAWQDKLKKAFGISGGGHTVTINLIFRDL